MHTGRLGNGGRLQMLAVKGQPNADLAAEQPHRATYRVEWVDIDDPAPSFPYTPGADRADHQRPGPQPRRQPGPRPGRRALLPAGGRGLRRRRRLLHARPRAAGRPRRASGRSPDGYGNGHGQIWAYHTRARMLQLLYQSPGPDVLDFPDNVTTSPRGTLVVCEDNVDDNYLRGLTRRRAAVRHRPQPAGEQHRRAPVQRRVRRLHVQPGRAHAVRQHPGQPRA